MKTGKYLPMLLAALALMSLSVPVHSFAQMKDTSPNHKTGGHGHMMESGGMGDMMGMCLEHADKMGLSEDQTRKLKPLHRDMQKKHARFVADQKIAEIVLDEIMEVKDFDLEKARSAVKNINMIKTAHHLEMLTAMKEMRIILTEQQFKDMKKMMSDGTGGKKPAGRHLKKHK